MRRKGETLPELLEPLGWYRVGRLTDRIRYFWNPMLVRLKVPFSPPRGGLCLLGKLRDHGRMLSATSNITTLGLAYHRRYEQPFGIKQADRMHHCFLIGQTGTGKSTLLTHIAMQDARSGRGGCLIDPHGDMAEELSCSLASDHIYWDVSDPSSPYGYNPLTRVPEHLRSLVASGFVETMKKQWHDSWGPRMEHLLRYAVLALLDIPNTDMRDIGRLYFDKDFRRTVVAQITDPQVRHFWTRELPNMNYLTTTDGLAPINNKIGAFLANPIIRKAVCEPEKPLRFRRLMDEGQTVIVNLAKGRIGAENADVLGGLLLSNIMNAAFSRHDIEQHSRRPFFLLVDEFHSFTTAVFADMLSEARKYALSLTLSQQHTTQTDKDVFEAVMGNVGTMLSLRLGATDAPIIAKQMGEIDAHHFTKLPNYLGYAQLLVDGRKTRLFSFQTRPIVKGFNGVGSTLAPLKDSTYMI